MDERTDGVYEFGPFRLLPGERLLLRGGARVSLPPKAFDTLCALAERRGRVVRRAELLEAISPDAFIEENNLDQYVSQLRRALGDAPGGARYIETVRGHGFRFRAEAAAAADAPRQTLLLHRRTRTNVVVREETSEERRRTTLFERDADSGAVPGADRRAPRGRGLAFVAAAAAALSLCVAAGLFFLRRPAEPTRTPVALAVRSVAVLPFRPLGARDGDEEYLGLGLADSLITKLGRLKQLSVRPTSAVQMYEADARGPTEIGRELKVDAALVGRFQRSGDRLRVTAQLVNVSDGTLMWTGQFDEKAADLLGVQDAVAEQAAEAMRLQLSAWERERLAKPATTNPEAYQAYLKGRYFWNKRTVEGLNKGIENFRRAIDLDPDYALAYAGLADCYNLLSEHNAAAPGESFAAAKRAAQKGLELDESLAEAHTALAYVLVNHEWDWAGGEREFRRALELNPSYATAHQWYAEFLGAMGRRDEQRAELERALELDPLSLIINAEQGLPFLALGQYDRAVEKFRKAVELDPNFPVAHAYLMIAHEFAGQEEQAFAERLTTARQSGYSPEALAAMEKAYRCCGLRGLWQRTLADQLSSRRANYYSAYMIAQTYARLGERGRALDWLEQAYKEHDRYMVDLQHDVALTALRPDPRFRDLLRRMNLGT